MVVCIVALQEAKPQQRYAVRVSLFDLPYKQFFGRTWTGYPVTAKDAPGNKVKFPYAQNVYFHSPVADDQVALVVEVIGTSGSGNEDDTSAVSLGWGFIRPFVGDGKLTDLSSGSDVTTRYSFTTTVIVDIYVTVRASGFYCLTKVKVLCIKLSIVCVYQNSTVFRLTEGNALS